MERGEYWGSIYQSPVDDAEAALQTALDVLAGEDVPFLNYFDTPKITQENMDEFDRRSSDLPPGMGAGFRRPAPVPPHIEQQTDREVCLGRSGELRGVCASSRAPRAASGGPSPKPFWTRVRRSASRISTPSRPPRWPRRTANALGRRDTVISFGVDVRDRAEVREMIETTVRHFGRLDVMFNNAGVNKPMNFMDVTEENWSFIMDINGLGCLIGMQEAARQMIAQGRGRRRQDRQHRLHRLAAGLRQRGALLRLEMGRGQPDAIGGARPGQA
jgi:hypothetical protein